MLGGFCEGVRQCRGGWPVNVFLVTQVQGFGQSLFDGWIGQQLLTEELRTGTGCLCTGLAFFLANGVRNVSPFLADGESGFLQFTAVISAFVGKDGLCEYLVDTVLTQRNG